MFRKFIVVVVVIAVLLFGAGVAGYTGLVTVPFVSLVSGESENSARYYPDDVLVYAWLTLNPSMGQRDNMLDIWNRINDMRAIRNLIRDFEDAVNDELELDIEDDILPWIGAEVSVAIMDIDTEDGEVDAALTIDVRDMDGAADFLADWMDSQEDGIGARFDIETINDFDVWADEDNHLAYSLTPDLLVFATNARTMEDVLERVEGKDSRTTLAEDEQFVAARAALPERRFASVYVDYERMAGVFGADDGFFGLGIPLVGTSLDSCGEALFSSPEWLAGSAAWVDRGLVFDLVSASGGNALLPASSSVADAGEALPEGALGFLSTSFDPNMDNWRDALSACPVADLIPDWDSLSVEANLAVLGLVGLFGSGDEPIMTDDMPELGSDSTLADALDAGLWAVDRLIGVHLEEDLFDYLDGDLIVAVHDVEFDSMISGDSDAIPIDGVSILSYRPGDEEALRATLDSLAQWLTAQAVDEVDMGADGPARVYSLDEIGLSPGYVIHDGRLTIGTTKKSLATTVALLKGDGAPLSADGEYSRAVGYLPDNRQSLFYIDIHRIMTMLDADDLSNENGDVYYALMDGIGVMAISANTDDDYSTATIVLTLFPGE